MKTTQKEYRFEAMGGVFQFFTYDQEIESSKLQNIFRDAELEVHRVEEKLTDFKESPFQLINENAGLRKTYVDEELFSLIKKSLEISRETNGVFDISYASVGHLWREAKKSGKNLSFFERVNASRFVNYKNISINENDSSVYLAHKEMKIGLGGIGKGYAVDRAYDILINGGLKNFYVNGSGDIRVHSSENAPRKWRFGVRNPFSKSSENKIGVVQLSTGSISSSGNYVEKNRSDNNKSDHHIIDPKFGFSRNQVVASTIFSDDAMTSDVYATVVMNMDKKNALKFLDEKNIAGAIVTKEGQCVLSARALNNFGI